MADKTPKHKQEWKPDPGLVCQDCGWEPALYYRYGNKAMPNKKAWLMLYFEHRSTMHEPHEAACFCVQCLK